MSSTINSAMANPIPTQLPVHRLVADYQRRMTTGLLLYAGTNFASPVVERILSSGLGQMPAIGMPHAKQQTGTQEISALEDLVEKQALEIFGGAWAECRLQSCTLANAAVVAGFSDLGDTVGAISLADGGHISHHAPGTVGLLNRRTLTLPFANGQYDDAAAGAKIAHERPKIVIVGASVMLWPYQLHQTIKASREVGALVIYDASHVLGLIAGGKFQNPMELGVDIMTASTYKSFGGPPGALVVGSQKAQGETLRSAVAGAWASNYDASRVAAISIALAEAKEFMPSYADAMLRNAAAFSKTLRRRDVNVLGAESFGSPQTHQVVVCCESHERGRELSRVAESCGIYVGTCNVPGEPNMGGLRFGTQAVTRMGAGTSDMEKIGLCVADLLGKGDVEACASSVTEIARQLPGFSYGYVN